MANGVRVLAHFHAAAGKADELHELLTSLIDPTRAEDGCRVYILWRAQEDSSHFTLVEEWESLDHLERHLEAAHLVEAKERFHRLLAQPLEIRTYDLVK